MNPQSAFEAPDPVNPRRGAADAAARTRGPRNRHAGRARLGLLAALVAVATLLALSAGSSALAGFSARPKAAAPPAPTSASAGPAKLAPASARRGASLLPRAAAAPAPFQAAPLSIFNADCSTVSTSYQLGSTICAKVGTVRDGLRIAFVDPGGFIRDVRPVSSNTDESFTLPTTLTDVIASFFTTENRGTWQITLINEDASLAYYQQINVRDTANVAADVSVVKVLASSNIPTAAAQDVVYDIVVKNYGPDDAANVRFTDATPNNTTFSSITQLSGPTFTCTNPGVGNSGSTTCNVATLPWNGDSSAVFEIVYKSSASSGVIEGGDIDVQSDTADLSAANNDSGSPAFGINGTTPAPCLLTCPLDVAATANVTEGGELGAHVTYSAASVVGDCGAVSNSPASGSFFTVGTHVVTSSSDSGASCTFNVKVLDTPPPTISCPADKTVAAASGSDSANVSVGAPTFTPAGSTITFARSDDKNATFDEDGNVLTPAVVHALTDPYPVGVTGITWTVTDPDGRTASCKQRINVVSDACSASDTQAPTITAPPDITVGTGPSNTGCSVALDDELGQPDVSDNCSVTVTVSGIPPGNEFAPGTYTLTYTATDGAGNTASATQHVTVIENTPPVIKAPADASYTCLEQVPAASPSQATRGVVLDEDGNPLPPGPPFDNCGVPAVTVSESSTGVGNAASPRVITRTFTATDAAGNTASDVQTITVIDPTPPVLTVAGPPTMTVECHTSFTDPGASATDNCAGAAVSVSGAVNINVPGTYTLTYVATDAVGNQSAPQTRTVTVVDTTPPVITLSGLAPSLWPANHKYVSFQVTDFVSSVTDSCDVPLNVSSVVIEKITSDETENGNGDGNTTQDIVIDPGCKSFKVRSERQGGGDGRVYTVTFIVKDASGNVTRATANLVVQHNPGETPVDSGPHYTVNGSCPP